MQQNNGLHCTGASPAQLQTLQEASSSPGSSEDPSRRHNIMKPTQLAQSLLTHAHLLQDRASLPVLALQGRPAGLQSERLLSQACTQQLCTQLLHCPEAGDGRLHNLAGRRYCCSMHQAFTLPMSVLATCTTAELRLYPLSRPLRGLSYLCMWMLGSTAFQCVSVHNHGVQGHPLTLCCLFSPGCC